MSENVRDYRDRVRTREDVDLVLALHRTPHAAGFVVAPDAQRVLEVTEQPGREERVIIDGDTPVGLWIVEQASEWLYELRLILAAQPRRGIGAFALRRAIEFVFDERRAHRFFLEIAADNVASRRLCEGAGFLLEGTWRDGFRCSDGTYKDLCAYGMLEGDRR